MGRGSFFMKLNFTRRTWYFCLLIAAAVSMLNGFAVLAGSSSLFFLEQCAFCLEAMAVLFLAAQKGAPKAEKGQYFGVFVVLMVSYMFAGWIAYVCAALAWPLLLAVEAKRGAPIQRQLSLVGVAETLHLLLCLASVYGGVSALSFWTNILWLLVTIARGAAALQLYKHAEEAA